MQAKIVITIDNGRINVEAPIDHPQLCYELLGHAITALAQTLTTVPILKKRDNLLIKPTGN
jgi:hypothetical protein